MNLLFIDGEVVEAATETIANEEVITIAEEPAAVETTAAQPAPAGSGSFWIMILAMIAIMYFFMWRPESKRRKQMENFRNGLKKGDKVITAGGIYGTVKEVQPTSLLIEVDSNVTLRVDKNMVVGAPGQQA
jgi:preprotein translocase subunit YajC